MDRWVTVTKSSTAGRVKNDTKDTKRVSARHHPYARSGVADVDDATQSSTWKEQWNPDVVRAQLSKNGKAPTQARLTKHLLNTLSDSSNPITHSDIYRRTVHLTSTATGHQHGEGRGAAASSWMRERTGKLRDQLPQTGSSVLSGVRVWIDGYLEDTTDIEMKRLIKLAGGEVLYTASSATHILTSQQLSGSKTHKLLTTKFKVKPHVVRPDWVFDSIDTGKRLSERKYGVVQIASTPALEAMFANPRSKSG